MRHFFTIGELLYSRRAIEEGIDNYCRDMLIEQNLDMLISNFLDPIRASWGGPIRVSSGYRCEMLNEIVGGSKTSMHKLGLAADLWVSGGPERNRTLARHIALYFDFDQLIDENGWSWVHFGIRPSGEPFRGEILRIKNGITRRIKIEDI